MYGVCVGYYGMQPSEYWNACPREIEVFIDTKAPVKYFGRLSEDEAWEMAESIKNDDRFV